MANEELVADAGTGVEVTEVTEPVSQPEAQAPVENQSVPTPPVEGVDNKTQVPEPAGPKYDGLFRSERKRIRRLEETITQLNKRLDENKTQVPKDEPLDHTLLNTDPVKYLDARERRLRDEIVALRNELVTERQSKEAVEKERKGLDALEKLFPKTSPDSKESLEERINRNPEMTEKIKEFFEDPAVKAMADKDPEKAVRFAIAELGIKPPTKDPLVLKKSAMGGVGTGNPAGGERKTVSEETLRAELKKINAQEEATPQVRFDENWRKRKNEVMTSLERLVTKK